MCYWHTAASFSSVICVFADGADCICDQEHLVISGCCYRNKIWIIMWVFWFISFFPLFFCLGLLQKVLEFIFTLHGGVALYNFRKEQIEIEAHRTDKG